MNIVLYEPEMPANTGNIGRTCVATNTKLHLIEPLGFKLSEKHLVRAGLDYWDKLDVTVYSDYQDFLKKNPGRRYTWRPQRVSMYTRIFAYWIQDTKQLRCGFPACFGDSWGRDKRFIKRGKREYNYDE